MAAAAFERAMLLASTGSTSDLTEVLGFTSQMQIISKAENLGVTIT